MQSLEKLESERTKLVAEKTRLLDQLQEISNGPPRIGQRAANLRETLKSRVREIDQTLEGMRNVRRDIYNATARPPRPVDPQVRTAVLFKVALAADEYLFGDIEDDAAGDTLEDALDELEKVAPGWKDFAVRKYREKA